LIKGTITLAEHVLKTVSLSSAAVVLLVILLDGLSSQIRSMSINLRIKMADQMKANNPAQK
jgi:hypothetical protein